jgi:hypothetical protein
LLEFFETHPNFGSTNPIGSNLLGNIFWQLEFGNWVDFRTDFGRLVWASPQPLVSVGSVLV